MPDPMLIAYGYLKNGLATVIYQGLVYIRLGPPGPLRLRAHGGMEWSTGAREAARLFLGSPLRDVHGHCTRGAWHIVPVVYRPAANWWCAGSTCMAQRTGVQHHGKCRMCLMAVDAASIGLAI